MRNFILPLLASAALTVALPAMADDAKPLAGQSITVLMPSPQGATVAADFEAETGIHVDLQTLSWDDIRPKLVAALIAGTAPADVTEFDWSWTGQFSAADWYLPLNDAIDAGTVADIAGSSIFTVNGKLLGVPYTNDFRVMLINKQHFDQAGITETPKTLDQLLARLRPMFFDPDVDPMVTAKTPPPGKNILTASANNLYVGVTMKDLEGFAEKYPDDLDPRVADRLMMMIPGRAITPAEIGASIVYLASPEARMITGAVFAHDGGMS